MSGGSLAMRQRIIDWMQAHPTGADASEVASAYGLLQRTVSSEMKFMRLEGVLREVPAGGRCKRHVITEIAR